jgi:tetratricopeptide (TPR) repeat protein
MKRTLVLGSLLLSSCLCHVGASTYSINKGSGDTTAYFVKMGAFSHLENAKRMQESTPFETNIHFLSRYYSLLSPAYSSKEMAEAQLVRIQKIAGDAYLIALYKKPAKPQVERKELDTYEKGVQYFKSGAYEDALIAFDRALIEDENNQKAKIFYARTLYKLKLYKEAKEAFESLINDRLSSQDTKMIGLYLERIAKQQKRHFFDGRLSVGAGYDSNINLTTDAPTTIYGPLTLINDTQKTDSLYALVSLQLVHQYKADSFTLISKLYSYNELAHTASGNNLNYLDISTGVKKSFEKWSIMIPVGFNTSILEGEEIGNNIYLNPMIRYNLSHYYHTYVKGYFHENSTQFSDFRDHQAFGSVVGIGYKDKQIEGVIQGGYTVFDAKDDVRFDVNKALVRTLVFGKYYISKALFVGGNLSFAKETYDDMDPVMGYAKESDILNAGLSVGKQMHQNGYIIGKYQYQNVDSNINAYSYDKNSLAVEYKHRF